MPHPRDVARQLLSRHGLTAKKSLGQNFLVDPNVLDRILDGAEVEPEDTVIEVGPGLGILTRALAERTRRVIAIELDHRMIAILGETLAGLSNVEIVPADILTVDPAELAGGRYLVVANLPYYITSAALRHFLEARRPPERMVVMIQKEVADRIVAKPGKLSLLAVSIQVYGKPRIVTIVPPTSFLPTPDVSSAVIRVDVRPEPLIEPEEREHFFKVVSAGFSQPRKQLHNALSRGLWFEPGGATVSLEAAGIDPARRAQTLSIEEWLRLSRVIFPR
ncbi:MAG: 16S rRNA (adenine(1518)-N(6)/adenine(1519)-N(6))-dimethyltransferase RsmA [Dehalococcoidia bacterium]